LIDMIFSVYDQAQNTAITQIMALHVISQVAESTLKSSQSPQVKAFYAILSSLIAGGNVSVA